MKLEFVKAYDRTEEVGRLFREYTDMLVAGDPKFKEYLEIQNYDEELRHLENKYGEPYGRLYLAYCDGELAGSIALRKLDDKTCEMKRLYVYPEFRGRGIARRLVEKIIADSREIGYSVMLLDTLPFLENAIRLYKSMGFYEIPCYNNSPMDNSIFLRYDIDN